jgi:hypothetical protein
MTSTPSRVNEMRETLVSWNEHQRTGPSLQAFAVSRNITSAQRWQGIREHSEKCFYVDSQEDTDGDLAELLG